MWGIGDGYEFMSTDSFSSPAFQTPEMMQFISAHPAVFHLDYLPVLGFRYVQKPRQQLSNDKTKFNA